MAKINGNDRPDADGMTVTEFLENEGYKQGRVVVEINLEILPKSGYDDRKISAEDTVEVVTFMGGG